MTIINSKVVKTRKEHYCTGCARKMPKGSKMEAVTGVDGGSIATSYWCIVCQTYWNKYMTYEDEVIFGELRSEDKDGWEEIRKNVEVATA